MKNYQVFIKLEGEIRIKAENTHHVKDIINDGFVVVRAVENGLFDIEIEDIHEFKEEK